MSTTYSAKKPKTQQLNAHNFVQPREKKILGFSGKLGSGKTSCCNWIHVLAFVHAILDENGNPFAEHARVNQEGKLITWDENKEDVEIILKPRSLEALNELQTYIWPFIRSLSFADGLKEFCVNLLGLSRELVYGSQEDKNTPTHIKWEDLPEVVWRDTNGKLSENHIEVDGEFFDTINNKQVTIATGYMTVRDVLEYVGTQWIRQVNPEGHANNLVNTINMTQSAFYVIDDVRFPNEVEAIERLGGTVIRLTRASPESLKNLHDSNTALDNYPFKHTINNVHLDMDSTFSLLMDKLIEIGWFVPVVS